MKRESRSAMGLTAYNTTKIINEIEYVRIGAPVPRPVLRDKVHDLRTFTIRDAQVWLRENLSVPGIAVYKALNVRHSIPR